MSRYRAGDVGGMSTPDLHLPPKQSSMRTTVLLKTASCGVPCMLSGVEWSLYSNCLILLLSSGCGWDP